MRTVKRTDEEIDKLLNEVEEASDSGERRFPGMSYEEGVAAGIKWLLGDTDGHPYEDE